MDFLVLAFVYFLVFALGASAGSFLSVVIYRVPANRSILLPPSHCPICKHRLTLQENVPILGWYWLKGRCSACKTPIPIRYPVLEVVCGLAFLVIFWQFGVSWETLGLWLFFGWLFALSCIDIDTMTLPNPLTQSGLVAGLVFQSIVGLSASQSLFGSIPQVMHGVFGAVLGLWLLDLIAIAGTIMLGQTAMGGGDAKLAAMMGAWLGWKLLLLAGFLACAIGAFGGGVAIAIGWLNRRQPFPFGPFLALGGIIAAIWGNAILSFYFRVFFPILSLSI